MRPDEPQSGDRLPLRVLYSFPDTVGKPGIGTTALHQVASLARAGAEITLVCTTLQQALPPQVRVIETLRLAGRRVPHRVFGSPERAAAYHDRRAARVLRDERFDVVHTWPGAATSTALAARRLGVLASREVPNTHTADAMEQAAEEAARCGVEAPPGTSHAFDAARLRAEEREFALADVLMVPSDHVRGTFLARGVSASRLERHQYGYDPARFSPAADRGRDGRPFTAVFVGTVEPRKGLHYALEAWSRGAPEGGVLRIAGRFQPAYGERLGPLLDQPTVEVLDFVDDIPALLRGSDVLLLPSVEEGSALVTYEAQGSGCLPLVSSASGAMLPPEARERLEHPTRAVDVLTDQLAEVGRDPGLLAWLREQVLDHAPSLTWDAAARRMLVVWAQRIGRPIA